MERRNLTVTDVQGNVVRDALVRIVLAGTSTLAAIFTDNGITPIGNPLITDGRGQCYFYAANGRYDAIITRGGVLLETRRDILLYDSANAAQLIDQVLGGGHFVQNGAKIQRVADRLLVAGATVNDGRFPNDTKDWLSTFQTAAGLSNGSIVSATSAILNGPNEQSAQTLVAGAQSLTFTSAATSCIGSSAYAVNNNPTYATKAWAFYGEAHKTNPTSSAVYGMELDTRTLVETINPNPYQQGDVIALQLASGCELDGTPQFDASAAIQIEPNPKKFKVGINMGSLALTAEGIAMALAIGHRLKWFRSGSPNAIAVAEIVSTCTTQSVCIDFATDMIQFKTLAGVTLASLDTTGRLSIGPAPTTPRTISAVKSAASGESIGSANNPQVFVRNTSGAALGEKAELNFAISAQDYACASISTQYSQFNASGDVGADLVFATRKSTADGGLKERLRLDANGRLFVANVSAAPAANPTGGGLLYVEGGALKFRGSSGTVTTIAPA